MAQYLTVEEAAQFLRVSVDRIREMVKKNELRAFLDRGTQRFRSQDIEEKARQMGLGSDPELALADSDLESSGNPSSSGRRKTKASKLGESQPPRPSKLGESPTARPSKLGESQRPSKLGGTTPPARRSGLKRPSRLDPPKASSDSEIRLVGQTGELNFDIDLGDDLDLAPPASAAGPRSPNRAGPESGVRIVPLEEDSDAKLETDKPADSKSIPKPTGKSPSDSDIRLEQVNPGGKPYEPLITEEIDLDAEESAAHKQAPAPRAKPGSSGQQPALPTSSPFELSESDLELKPLSPDAGPRTPKPSDKGVDSSSDFELAPGGDSDELTLSDEDAVNLGELGGGGPQASGINLQDPGDSGISLEPGGSDELEIGLAPVAGGNALASSKQTESSSEFELSLDDEEGDSSSEFELTLDDDEAGPASATDTADSDSEFELTLDEDGDLAATDDTNALDDDDEGKDIFEPTDFDVPALDDESSSEAVALSEMGEEGSSEFDLDLDEDEMGGVEEDDEEEGVAEYDEDLEEGGVVETDEDADEAAETVTRPIKKARGRKAAVEEDDDGSPYEGIHEDDEDSEEEVGRRPAAGAAAALPPAEWGMFPALMLLPTVIVLFVVGLMSYELSRSMLGYRGSSSASTSMVLHPLAKSLDSTLPDKK